MPKTILIIDDNQESLEMLRVLFEEIEELRDYSLRLYGEPGQAVQELVQQQYPDLILLDLFNNRHDAQESLHFLSSFQQLPIVLFTAANPSYVQQIAQQYTISDIIQKPFDVDDFIQHLAHACQCSQNRQETYCLSAVR